MTILGPGIDAAVRRIETQHDLLGRVATVTSFDAPDGGNAVNQILREYTGFGRLAREYQEHGGVKQENTLYAEYDYAGASCGLRPVSLRYPNGRLLHYTYGTTDSTADVLGRLDAIRDDSGGVPGTTLAQYTYLGLGTVVVEDYAQPQVKLDRVLPASVRELILRGWYAEGCSWDFFRRTADAYQERRVQA